MSFKEKAKKVDGKGNKELMFYSLSTCHWCDKAKEYFDQIGLGYNYVVVDELEGADQQEAISEISKYNPNLSFPTFVINDGEKVIIGFDQAAFDELAK
jgi:glutaredoxin-like protein NrdH